MNTRILARAALAGGFVWLVSLLALFVVSGRAPSGNPSNATLLAWLVHHTATAKALGWLALVNVLATVAVFGAVREWLRQHERSGWSGILLAGVVIYSVGLLAELGIYFAAAKNTTYLTPASVGALRTVADLGQLTQDTGVAILAAISGIAILHRRSLSAWIGWTALAVAAAAAIPLLDPLGAFAFLAWTAAVCVAVYLRSRIAMPGSSTNESAGSVTSSMAASS